MAADPGHVAVADATHELYNRYGRRIYAYCLHHLGSREEAEDAVQTTFLNAFRGLQRGTVTHAEQAWLYKIAQNVCFARRASSGRRLRLEAPNNFEILKEIVPSRSAGDTLELLGLETALERIPENQRKAFVLREFYGLSYREIGEELRLTQGAVEMLIFRARRSLATALEQPEDERRSLNIGSLVTTLKSLFNGTVAVKLVTVAMSAAVASTTTAHTVISTFAHDFSSVRTQRFLARQTAVPSAPAAVQTRRTGTTTVFATTRSRAPVSDHVARPSLHVPRQAPAVGPPEPASSAPVIAKDAPVPVETPAPAPPTPAPTPATPPPPYSGSSTSTVQTYNDSSSGSSAQSQPQQTTATPPPTTTSSSADYTPSSTTPPAGDSGDPNDGHATVVIGPMAPVSAAPASSPGGGGSSSSVGGSSTTSPPPTTTSGGSATTRPPTSLGGITVPQPGH